MLFEEQHNQLLELQPTESVHVYQNTKGRTCGPDAAEHAFQRLLKFNESAGVKYLKMSGAPLTGELAR